MQKVGIMGGTFNPVHYGHLFLAENAMEQLNLDKILFMPSKNPPHKKKQDLVSDMQRIEMVRLAVYENPHFEISTIEFDREGITYTADTLTILTHENPDTEYYFIVGADSLFMMQDWHTPQIIFNLCTILAAGRDRVPENQLAKQMKYLRDTFDARIIQLNMPTIEISSAVIRKRIAANKTVRYFVPKEVMDYIAKHRLYEIMLKE